MSLAKPVSSPSSVASQLVRNVVAATAFLGVDVVALQAAVGLTPERLSDPEARIPRETFIALFEEGTRLTGDDAFGLHVAEIARRRTDNVLSLALHSSSTLGDAYRRAARYVHLVNDTLEIRLELEGAACWLIPQQHGPEGSARQGVEFSLVLLFLFGRQALGSTFRLEKVSFRHPPPRSAAEHARLFEAPIAFGQPRDALVFARSLLDAPLSTASERYCRHLDRLMDEMLTELPRRAGVAEQVRAALAANLKSGPTLDHIAERLGTTPRSLQRRLQAEGTSYNDLLDELRRELSLRYLDQRDLALVEVAFLLGFAEQSAFQRAFKRWTGDTPAQWRRRDPQRPGE
jgi:AraC-like DNA-binding protein